MIKQTAEYFIKILKIEEHHRDILELMLSSMYGRAYLHGYNHSKNGIFPIIEEQEFNEAGQKIIELLNDLSDKKSKGKN